MDKKTRELFGHQYLGPPKEKRGHTVRLETNGCSVRVKCSCGFKGKTSTGWNRSGYCYAILAQRDQYDQHIADENRNTGELIPAGCVNFQ